MQHLMRKEGCHNHQLTFIIELSDPDMNMQQQASAILLHKLPTSASHHNIMFTDECAVYLSARTQNILSGLIKIHISLKKCTASTFCYDVGWSHQRIVVGPYLYDL
jgi:hypothetical protein